MYQMKGKSTVLVHSEHHRAGLMLMSSGEKGRPIVSTHV